MIKKILKAVVGLLNIFANKSGHNIYVHKKNAGEYFSYSIMTNFTPGTGVMKIYEDSIRHVGGAHTDNIYKRMRLYMLMDLMSGVLKKHAGADVAECGCWNGHSTHIASTLMKQYGFKGQFHVFDSFEGGLSEFTEYDREGKDTVTKEQEEKAREYFESSFDAVASRLRDFDFVHLYKGWIPDRFDEVSERAFGFVFIDVDMYEPIMDSLEFFYPRLIEGGIIFLDDYNYAGFPGAKRAVDDFLSRHTPSAFVTMPFGSCYIMK